MIKYVAGIDAGTTGLKTIIFDLQGRAIGKDYEEYPCITPRVGWVEQDVYCLWNALCHTVKGAIANAGVDPKEIGSVGISSQRGTFFAIDENWEPLHNSIVWSDGRAVEEVQWIKENIGVEKYHKISGAPVSGAWSYAKYKWVRDHQPELYEKTFMFAFFIYAIIFNSLNTRSEKFNLFEHIGENKNFVLVMGAIFVLQTIIIEIGGKVFNTTLLEPKALLVSMVLAVLIIPVDLIRKAIMSR